jgi:protein-tyrosine-phosphatase
MVKILFVCTGNTCRSPMAEFYFKDQVKKNKLPIQVRSAGLSAYENDTISNHSKEVLSLNNIPCENFTSTPLTLELVEESNFIIGISFSHYQNILYKFPAAQGKCFPLISFLNDESASMDILDPFGGSLAVYQDVFLMMKPALDNMIKLMKDVVSNN